MQAFTCRSAARRCALQQAAKRPLGGGALLGCIPSNPLATAAAALGARASLHASAPALGGGTPGEWNHVHQWKTKAKLAAMKAAAEAAAGGAKGKGKDAGGKQEAAAAAPKAGGASGSGPGIAPLPGEKVLVLDESLPDGALEEYFAGLRSSSGTGAQGEGAGAAAGGAEGAGKPRRKTIKTHMLFGWTYKKAGGSSGGKGAGAPAAGGAKAGASKPQQQQPKKKAAAAAAPNSE